MSRYLIDTNILSELRKGDRANRGVRYWFEQNESADMWLSVLVVGELQRGVQLIARRDPVAAASLAEWVQTIVEAYDDHILDVDLDVALTWSRLGVPDPVPVVDGLLAATALTHDLILVTRNEADVELTGVQLFNPFNIMRDEVHPGPFEKFIEAFLTSPAAASVQAAEHEILHFLDGLESQGSNAIIAPLSGSAVAEMNREIKRVEAAGGDWLDACGPQHFTALLAMTQVDYALNPDAVFDLNRLTGYRATFAALASWGTEHGHLTAQDKTEVLRMIDDFPIEH